MGPMLLADCVVCVAERHDNGFFLLGGVIALLSVVLALGMLWLDRRAAGRVTLQAGFDASPTEAEAE